MRSMKVRLNRRQRVVLSILVLLVVSVTVMSLAFFNSTDAVTNRITSKNPPKIALNEPKWYQEGEELAKRYVPDIAIPKDPYVTNLSEYDVYVRMKIEVLGADGNPLDDEKQTQAILNSLYIDDKNNLKLFGTSANSTDSDTSKDNQEDINNEDNNDNANIPDDNNVGDDNANADNDNNGGDDNDNADGDSQDDNPKDEVEKVKVVSKNLDFFYCEDDEYFYYGTSKSEDGTEITTNTLTPLAPNGSTTTLFNYVVTPNNTDFTTVTDVDGNKTDVFTYDLYFSKPFSIKVSAEAIYVLTEQEETFDEIRTRFDRS
jgi:hypothetical protein